MRIAVTPIAPLLVAAASLFTAAHAAAQDDEADWNRGVDLREAGRDAEALEHFERMHRASGSARTLAQVGFAEQALGRWGAAAHHLNQATAAPDAWVAAHGAAMQQARAEIARHVGNVEVIADRSGVDVELDGVVVGRTPLGAAVPATAGTVRLRLLRGGRVLVERSLIVQVGALSRETVAVPAGGGGGGDSTLSALGWTGLAIGIGAAIGTGIAWGLREHHAQAWNSSDRCTAPGATRRENCPDEIGSAQRAEAAAIGLGIAAGVFVALGITLVAVGESGGGSEGASLRCSPSLGGVACDGSF
ncbi:MAG: hypothetical protein AB7S26_02980 [Sandaracinaceae bacterium]